MEGGWCGGVVCGAWRGVALGLHPNDTFTMEHLRYTVTILYTFSISSPAFI